MAIPRSEPAPTRASTIPLHAVDPQKHYKIHTCSILRLLDLLDKEKSQVGRNFRGSAAQLPYVCSRATGATLRQSQHEPTRAVAGRSAAPPHDPTRAVAGPCGAQRRTVLVGRLAAQQRAGTVPAQT